MDYLKNKIAIVTGGSKGLGRAVAMLMATKGVSVSICARDEDALANTCREIKTHGGNCAYFKTDVTKEDQVNAMVDNVLNEFGGIDILINNAGVGLYKPVSECTVADWNYIMDTNLKGYFLCSKAVIPVMQKQKAGHIVNVASGAGHFGIENLALYCASKFGTIGFSESLRKELDKFGVRVTYISPGYINTDFFKDFPQNYLKSQNSVEPEKIAAEIVKKITHRETKPFSLFRRYFS